MPNFAATFSDGATLARWTDPPSEEQPSRINPAANHPFLRRRADAGELVEVSAVVGGVTGPLDAALGGELFVGWFAEYPSASPPTVAVVAGQTSVRRFTPTAVGHYTYVLRRVRGGCVILHLDVV